MFNRNEIVGDHLSKTTGTRRPWFELEEFRPNGGMWAIPGTLMRGEFIRRTSELMSDPGRFEESMRRAIREWPASVETAFETPGLNLRAWLGHAGCYLATGSPEETTRLGWHDLDDGEQRAANAAADNVIAEYRRQHAPDSGQDCLWEGDYA